MSMSSQIENLNKLEIAKNLAYDYVKSNTENTELIVGNSSLEILLIKKFYLIKLAQLILTTFHFLSKKLKI